MYIISRNNYLQQKKIEFAYLHYEVKQKKNFPFSLNSFFPTFSSQLKIFYRFFPNVEKKETARFLIFFFMLSNFFLVKSIIRREPN